MQRNSCVKTQRQETGQCVRRAAGGSLWGLELRGQEVIRQLDQGSRIWVLEVLGYQGGF